MRRMARRCEAVVAAAWCKRGRVTALFWPIHTHWNPYLS
jgi:hypothetical protein